MVDFIITHLMDYSPGGSARTACGLPWVPEPQNQPEIPRVLCDKCAQNAQDAAEFPRQGEGEVLKVRFGNDFAAVVAEHKVTNIGTGWHINRVRTFDNSHLLLAFLGRAPWTQVEATALKFVALLEDEVRERHRLRDAEYKVTRLVEELRQQ